MKPLFTLPLTGLGECAAGHHTWQTTAIVGKSVCVVCGTVGYCLSCCSGDIPPGSPLRACRIHRHRPARLADSARPLSAFTREKNG